ncbi:hypothetical protein QWJ07_24500 [Frankia sp. RB7]|nr:hypothetical protein [Frankia sp. RB7]
MKGKKPSGGTVGQDIEEAPAGGTFHWPENTALVPGGYREALGPFEPFAAGSSAGRSGATVESARIPILTVVEAARDALVGRATSVQMKALANIEGIAELGDISAPSVIAAAENAIGAAKYAAEEMALPVIRQHIDARYKVIRFEIAHGQDPIAPNIDYELPATELKPVLQTGLAIPPDALINSVSLADAMQHGFMQAVATAGFGSATVAVSGALAGTGLRFFNDRKNRGRRLIWRIVTVSSSLLGLGTAICLAQYRALLEAVASDAPGAATQSIFMVAPSIVGLPIFTGSVLVFLYAVHKWRGGRGSPFARYADHASYDRAFRIAEKDLARAKEDFTGHLDQICDDHMRALLDAHKQEEMSLKQVKRDGGDAKRRVGDLRNSFFATVRAAQADLAMVDAGFHAARPDLDPADFPPVSLRPAEFFPDVAEIDAGIARAEAGLARRAGQIAALEVALGDLIAKARDDFARFLAKAGRREETTRSRNRTIEAKGERL